jgi:secondary thiamine-phosphate synthase enzyme
MGCRTTAVVTKLIKWASTERRELIDITSQVMAFVENSHVQSGICVVTVPHATAAVIANEHEDGLMRDILAKVDNLFPKSSHYSHNAIDDNADAHLASAFLGHSRVFPVVNGSLVRGTWQNIFLVELDGPRSRRDVVLQLIGD